MPQIQDFCIIGLVASLSFFLSKTVIIIAKRFRWYDGTGGRKIHSGQIPRLGGIAVFISCMSGCFLLHLLNNGTTTFFNERIFLIAMIVAFASGIIDDFRPMRGIYKLIIQTSAAILATIAGLTVETITIPGIVTVNMGFLAYPLTVVWIVAIMNAVNLIDGIDGLSSGVTMIALSFVSIVAYFMNNYSTMLISLIVLFSILGFYFFNFPPAKLFIGDGGAYFIGFMFATISLMGVKKSAMITLFLVPIILMLVPIIDVLQVMLIRYRAGNNMFHPDKSHLHHRLLSLGLSVKGILVVMYGHSIALGLCGVLMLFIEPGPALLLMVIIGIILFLSFFTLHKAENALELREETLKSFEK